MKGKRMGRIQAIPQPPPLMPSIKNRFYVVLVGIDQGDEGIYQRWKGPTGAAQATQIRGSQPEWVVLHGFPSKAEVEQYLAGAEQTVPWKPLA